VTDPLYHLVIADDHPLFRGALGEAVAGLIERAEIAEAGSFDEAAGSTSSCSTSPCRACADFPA
jgi:DNA-binding NarL/FixJ family response regulator